MTIPRPSRSRKTVIKIETSGFFFFMTDVIGAANIGDICFHPFSFYLWKTVPGDEVSGATI
jgi:hypothetical protein